MLFLTISSRKLVRQIDRKLSKKTLKNLKNSVGHSGLPDMHTFTRVTGRDPLPPQEVTGEVNVRGLQIIPTNVNDLFIQPYTPNHKYMGLGH